MQKFEAELKHPIKWSVGQSVFEDPKKTKTLTLTIPVESIPGFCNHLMKLEEQEDRHRSGSVWDYEKQEKKVVKVVHIRAGGREGNFGNINPTKATELYNTTN